jgi:Trypsin-co-occurring domain 2
LADDLAIPLAAVIRALRHELVEAVTEGEDKEVRFALGPIELELQVEVTSTGGGAAGIKFWVMSVSGKGERTSGRTQTVRISLTPVIGAKADGDRPLVVGSEQVKRPR